MYTLRELSEKFKADENYKGNVKTDVNTASLTSMKVGGIAPLLLEPEDEKSFIYAADVLDSLCVGSFILGGGSNIIISDAGFEDVVISLKSLNCVEAKLYKQKNPRIDQLIESYKANYIDVPVPVSVHIGAGCSWGRVLSWCRERAMYGFESFSGLPGTVGGALFMNAQCFNHRACDNLLSVTYYEEGKVKTYYYNKRDWDYKKSPFQNSNMVILSADFICLCNSEEFIENPQMVNTRIRKNINDLCNEAIEERKDKGHFKKPSAGSVFKNDADKGIIAGKLIDECGLKGVSYGGAQVAPWHGNFIINNGYATAEDIKRLIDNIKSAVLRKTGYNLECEVIFCGLWKKPVW